MLDRHLAENSISTPDSIAKDNCFDRSQSLLVWCGLALADSLVLAIASLFTAKCKNDTKPIGMVLEGTLKTVSNQQVINRARLQSNGERIERPTGFGRFHQA